MSPITASHADTAARVRSTVRDDIQAMTAYAVPSAEGYIKLDAMECPWPLPDVVRDAVAEAVRNTPLNRYPAADPTALKAALREAFGVPAEAGLVLGNGSDELIHLLIQATCQPGDVVLAPWPSFVMFSLSAGFDHARFEGVTLTDDFLLDLPAMLAAIERHQPKLIFLAVPNNPTGRPWAAADIEAVVRAAPGLVVIDEAYQPFSDVTWMPRVLECPNVVVLRTVSKIGLAGLRLGYLSGHPAWLAEIDKVRPPYNINVLTEAAALAVLAHQEVLDGQATALRAGRATLHAALAGLPGVQVWPSQANFILARFAAGGDAVHAALKSRHILVKNLSHAHPLLADCLRISVGTPDENAALLAVLNEFLSPCAQPK